MTSLLWWLASPAACWERLGGGRDMQEDCVVHRIKVLFPECIAQPAVHSLDMDTSGLMVLARTKEAHRNLSIQFERREVEKKCVALLEGRLNQHAEAITIAFRLAPCNRHYQVMIPSTARWEISRWRLMGCEGECSRIEFIPLTGRTHQLRLHAAHPLGLGIPIVGDRLYGTGKEVGELRLHATRLAFCHPASSQNFHWYSPPSF